jgi:hypothetical protein
LASGIMFAELHVVAGERQDSSDLVGIATSPVLSLFKRRRGQLFTIVDPSRKDAGAQSLCRRLIEIIEDEYFRDPSRSITRSLQAAIVVANDALQSENAKVSPSRQLRAGVCCAAARDGDIFIAQVAPATAFILHNGLVTRVFSSYGVKPEPGSSAGGHTADSLGAHQDPHINFGFSPLGVGDLVLLATGTNWKMIPDRYVGDAARQIDPEMAAQELYSSYIAHTRRPTTSMIVMQMAAAPARARAGGVVKRNTAASEHRNGTAKREKLPAGVGVMEAAELETELPWSGRVKAGATVQPRRREEEPYETERRPSRAGTSSASRARAQEREDVRKPRSKTGLSLWDRLSLSLGRGQRKPPRLPGPSIGNSGKASVKLRRPPQMRGDRRRSTWIVQLAMMVLLAAIFVVVGNAGLGFWKSWQVGDPELLLRQAQEKQTEAATADTPALARADLVLAADLISRALRAKDDQSVRAMAATVQGNIDKMDGVVRVGSASVAVDFSSVAQDKGAVTQLMLNGNSLYVLDGGQSRVFKYILSPDGRGVQGQDKLPVLLKKGDRVDGRAVGDLISMTWMPAGQLRTQPTLFVLESSRSIISYDPLTGPSRIDVSENQRWGTIKTISGFAGGLYMLDSKQKSLYYYPPTKNGYESQAYVILDANTRIDLSKAADIALDGNLYLLDGAGIVRRFTREGRPLDFVGDIPDGKIADPKALFADASTRSLYVLDGAGERILQFSPEGKFQRQFKADGKNVSFRDAQDLFVDEANRHVYLLTSKSLLVFDLPPMQ